MRQGGCRLQPAEPRRDVGRGCVPTKKKQNQNQNHLLPEAWGASPTTMSDFDFRIRYWGTTGTMARPPRPDELLDKLSSALRQLHQQDALSDLAELDPEAARAKLCELLPIWMRSSYGGNTTCVEVETPDELIIVDAGSGFRELGNDLSQRWNETTGKSCRRGYVLLTHAHLDHTLATPYFDPYYDPRNEFYILGPQSAIDSLDTVLSAKSALRNVYFPITFDQTVNQTI